MLILRLWISPASECLHEVKQTVLECSNNARVCREIIMNLKWCLRLKVHHFTIYSLKNSQNFSEGQWRIHNFKKVATKRLLPFLPVLSSLFLSFPSPSCLPLRNLSSFSLPSFHYSSLFTVLSSFRFARLLKIQLWVSVRRVPDSSGISVTFEPRKRAW